MSQKLRKIMVDKVVTVDPSATVKKAVELMNLHDKIGRASCRERV